MTLKGTATALQVSWSTTTTTKAACGPLFSSSSAKSPMSTVARPWYSDSGIIRDRSHVLKSTADAMRVASADSAKFVLVEARKGMYHKIVEGGTGPGTESTAVIAEPLLMSFGQVEALIGSDEIEQAIRGESSSENILAWVGQYEGSDYWTLYLPEELPENLVAEVVDDEEIKASPLREFGDSLASGTEAALLASCNGLVEFHKSHPFCAKCGSETKPAKVGASRKCTNPDCSASFYPRIDVASIMLITSSCGEYALLGRKANWPKGRYSTLAGFAEVGETLEQCCARETFEESGVEVDLGSVEFVCSQPWPFPRSLMAGFKGRAAKPGLPPITIEEEMEKVKWFKRDFVKDRLDGGSTAMTFQPNEQEAEFHVPGQASLARMLITQWATEEN